MYKLFAFFFLYPFFLFAQEAAPVHARAIWHPLAVNEKPFVMSFGFVTTTTPQDIAEEIRVRIPAGDIRAIRKGSNHVSYHARILFQIVQNHFSVGVKYFNKFNSRLSLSAGNDFAFWEGKLNIGDFDTKGRGWLAYPNVSLGYNAGHQLLFTLSAEAIISRGNKFTVGQNELYNDGRLLSGSAYTIAMEQPFFHQTSISLAFTATYADFFWQSWTLFETFDRNIFYPQFTIALVL
jgi:hypothetical protein